jgi:hypothetical protein
MPGIPNAQRSYAVTTSDSVAIAQGPCEALWIGVAGTLSYIPFDPALAGGGAAVATTVPAGLFPVKVVRVNLTGTAATGIVALY